MVDQVEATFNAFLGSSSCSISAAGVTGLHGIVDDACLFPHHAGCICSTKGRKTDRSAVDEQES
jgi:hypothetical protein